METCKQSTFLSENDSYELFLEAQKARLGEWGPNGDYTPILQRHFERISQDL